MTPARPLIPELAKMVEEGRLRHPYFCEYHDEYVIWLHPRRCYASGVLCIFRHGNVRLRVRGVDVPGVSTQSDAAAWIARRINQTPAKAGGETK